MYRNGNGGNKVMYEMDKAVTLGDCVAVARQQSKYTKELIIISPGIFCDECYMPPQSITVYNSTNLTKLRDLIDELINNGKE